MKQENTLPDGTIIDITSLDLITKLTPKEARFVFWYTFPDSESFLHKTRSALKAGYKSSCAGITGSKLAKKLYKVINSVLDNQVKSDLQKEYHKILELKKTKSSF